MIPLRFIRRPGMKIVLVGLALLGFLVPEAALATTQFPDILYIDGQKHSLFSNPLEQYYGPSNPRPKFRAPNTATWRGYIATWEIDRGVLYLKAIRAWTQQGEVGLEGLFPGPKGRVVATWFTGKLRVPQGKVLKPGVGYRSVYEKDLMITVEKGRVVRQEIIDNTGQRQPPGQ
jgi:hypothetical protein